MSRRLLKTVLRKLVALRRVRIFQRNQMTNNGGEISVDVEGKRKWVTGIGRSTTCADVIHSVLISLGCPNPSEEVRNYALCEIARGVERQLRTSDRIKKVSKQWEDSNLLDVQIVLRKVDRCEMIPLKPQNKKNKGWFKNSKRGPRDYSSRPNVHDDTSLMGSNKENMFCAFSCYSKKKRSTNVTSNHFITGQTDSTGCLNRKSSADPISCESESDWESDRAYQSGDSDYGHCVRLSTNNSVSMQPCTGSFLQRSASFKYPKKQSESLASRSDSFRGLRRRPSRPTLTERYGSLPRSLNRDRNPSSMRRDSSSCVELSRKDTEGRSCSVSRLAEHIFMQELELIGLMERINRVSEEIEDREYRMHAMRSETHGRDYVQDSYLSDDYSESVKGKLLMKLQEMNEMLSEKNQQIAFLEEKLFGNYSLDIDEHAENDIQIPANLQSAMTALQDMLEESADLSTSQQNDIEDLEQYLSNYEELYQAKEALVVSLVRELDTLRADPNATLTSDMFEETDNALTPNIDKLITSRRSIVQKKKSPKPVAAQKSTHDTPRALKRRPKSYVDYNNETVELDAMFNKHVINTPDEKRNRSEICTPVSINDSASPFFARPINNVIACNIRSALDLAVPPSPTASPSSTINVSNVSKAMKTSSSSLCSRASQHADDSNASGQSVGVPPMGKGFMKAFFGKHLMPDLCLDTSSPMLSNDRDTSSFNALRRVSIASRETSVWDSHVTEDSVRPVIVHGDYHYEEEVTLTGNDESVSACSYRILKESCVRQLFVDTSVESRSRTTSCESGLGSAGQSSDDSASDNDVVLLDDKRYTETEV